MPTPSFTSHYNRNPSPSHFPSSAEPASKGSTCSMLHSNPLPGDYADTSITTYSSAHPSSSSSAQTAATSNESPNPQNSLGEINIDLSDWDGGSPPCNIMEWPTIFGQGIDDESINVDVWMPGSGNLPSAPNVAVPWEPAPEKKPLIDGLLKRVEHVLPTPGSLGVVTPNAAASSPMSGKRRRPEHQTHSDSEEGNAKALPKKHRGPCNADARHPHRPTRYPLAIPHEIRELRDEDFETICEWCPFYNYEPWRYSSKPFNSCGKPKTEISHIVTHLTSDHGLVRGSNSRRKNQRYITRCATHNSEKKGKADCNLCQQVEEWTEEELADPTHEGSSVCIRCYEQFNTKRELYFHLHEQSICLYKEDFSMRRKSRILYSVFCSSNEAPKWNPPPETATARDGARKRNMRHDRASASATASETSSIQNNGRGSSRQLPITPISSRPQQWSPHSLSLSPVPQRLPNQSYNPDVTTTYYPTTQPNAQPNAQPTQAAQTTQSQRLTQPSQYGYIRRHPIPSNYSDFDLFPSDFIAYLPQMMPLNQTDPTTGLAPTPSMVAQTLQPGAALPVGAQVMPKHMSFGAADSGIGSQSSGDNLHTEDFTFSQQALYNVPPLNEPQSHFFNQAWERPVPFR